MYSLTLTKSERDAIDWVGGRYATGDIYKLIWSSSCEHEPKEVDWDFDGDITFKIPEHVAWGIQELSEEEDDLWPCFADGLRAKMQDFINEIV